jgi:hypothetical protein
MSNSENVPTFFVKIARARIARASWRKEQTMKRPGDKTPEPPGGRAAERLRMFEDARRPKEASGKPKKGTLRKGGTRHEKQARRKD